MIRPDDSRSQGCFGVSRSGGPRQVAGLGHRAVVTHSDRLALMTFGNHTVARDGTNAWQAAGLLALQGKQMYGIA